MGMGMAMASSSSSSLFNFLSLLLPSQLTKKKPPQIISTPSYCDSLLPSLSSSTTTTTTTTSSSSVSFLIRRNSDGFVPITSIQKSSSQNDILSVVCPSLAYSNTLFCTPYNVEITFDGDESIESLISRFRRQVLRARVIQDCKRRRFHENSQEERKRKSRDAARRNKRRRTAWRDEIEEKDEEALKEEEEKKKKKKTKDDDEHDNWEYYEEGIPYY